MGLRYLTDYVHQFHLYIDDLIVVEEFRSQKIGAVLLAFAEDLAKKIIAAVCVCRPGWRTRKEVAFMSGKNGRFAPSFIKRRFKIN